MIARYITLDYAQYDLCDWYVFKGDTYTWCFFSVSLVSGIIKILHWDLLRHHKCDKSQTLHDGTTH